MAAAQPLIWPDTYQIGGGLPYYSDNWSGVEVSDWNIYTCCAEGRHAAASRTGAPYAIFHQNISQPDLNYAQIRFTVPNFSLPKNYTSCPLKTTARQTIYESVIQPLTRLSNTACPQPGAHGAQDCKPMARLRYCVSTAGCRILFTEATDLGPVPQSAAAKTPPACASLHVNGQSACDLHPQ